PSGGQRASSESQTGRQFTRYTACMRFGIDFGTTHTVVAVIDRGNYPIVSFEHTDAIPSIVGLDPQGELRFGHAERGWTVLRSFKRLLNDAHVDTEVRIGDRSILLAELLTRFFAHVREQLWHHSNAGLRRKDRIEAAVSVPANASTAQRLITMDAYRRAGFDVKAVLNEPSAAGFEYAHRFRETVTAKREYVLVYDLGGGTFDASLIHMEGRTNEVVTSSGISRLGGDDFDEAIAHLVLSKRRGRSLTPHLLGSSAIGLAIRLDEGAGYRVTERLTRHVGVFREDEHGGRISFDVLVPKDPPLPAEVSRRYRAAHNVGHYRFVECGRIDEGRPEGNLAAWDELLFPFDPSLRDRDLAAVPVQRLGHGPEVEETYRCGADGTVTASLRVLDDGFEKTARLSRR